MDARVFDDKTCSLGEGPLWHPKRQELIWFDIVGKTMFARNSEGRRQFEFDEYVSAAGWIDESCLLVASQSALLKFDMTRGQAQRVVALEADNAVTRSNDGRADPWGGFWIGTMGIDAEMDAGAIYRYFKGELRQLYAPLTIPNAICFSPDGSFAYFADTAKSTIWRQRLEERNGWPDGAPEIFLDFSGSGIKPDGAVCDMGGNLWNAQWGAGRVAQYSPDGKFMSEIKLPIAQTTCPAFGGGKRASLFVTSAKIGLSQKQNSEQPKAGCVFAVETDFQGQEEHQLVL